MRGQTLELARRTMDALSAQDLPQLLELADPQIEWHSFFAQLVEGGLYRGAEGTRRYLDDLRDAFEVARAEVDDSLEVGDLALLVGRLRYRGKGSGVETASPAGWVLKFRNGKLLRFQAFRDPERALEGLGREGGS